MLHFVFERHRDELETHKLSILRTVPEVISPLRYSALLPVSRDEDRPDAETIADWYVQAARRMDSEAGLLNHTLEVCELGLERLPASGDAVERLKSIQSDAWHLSRLVYDGVLTPLMTFEQWQTTPLRARLHAVLETSDAGTIEPRLREYALPLASTKNNISRVECERIIIEHVARRASVEMDGLRLSVAIAKASKTSLAPPQRLITNDAILMKLVLAAAYTDRRSVRPQSESEISADLSAIWDLFECVPQRLPELEAIHAEFNALQDELDLLESHLICCDVASKYGLVLGLLDCRDADVSCLAASSQPLSPFNQGRIDELKEMETSGSRGRGRGHSGRRRSSNADVGSAGASFGCLLIRHVCASNLFDDASAREATDASWRGVLDDIELLTHHLGSWAPCPDGWSEQCTFGALLAARAFTRARALIEDTAASEGDGSAARALEAIALETAQEYFDSAVDPTGGDMEFGAQCLACCRFEGGVDDSQVARERRLHEAFRKAHELGSSWLPVQWRLCSRPLDGIRSILADNPNAYRLGSRPALALVAMAELLGADAESCGDASQAELFAVQLVAASAAHENGDHGIARLICSTLLEPERRESARDLEADALYRLIVSLLRTPAAAGCDMLDRKALCETALTRCTQVHISPLLACWSELDAISHADQTSISRGVLLPAAPCADRLLARLDDTLVKETANSQVDERHCEASLHLEAQRVNTLPLPFPDGDENGVAALARNESDKHDHDRILKALAFCQLSRRLSDPTSSSALQAADGGLSVALSYLLSMEDDSEVPALFSALMSAFKRKRRLLAPTLAPESQAAVKPKPDEAVVALLISRGFQTNGARRSALAVGNAGADAAFEWAIAHVDDPDFSDPLPEDVCGPVCGGAQGGGDANGSEHSAVVSDAASLASACATRLLGIRVVCEHMDAASCCVVTPSERQTLYSSGTSNVALVERVMGGATLHPLRDQVLKFSSQGKDAGLVTSLQRFVPGLDPADFADHVDYRRRALSEAMKSSVAGAVPQACQAARHYGIDEWQLLLGYLQWLLTDEAPRLRSQSRGGDASRDSDTSRDAWAQQIAAALKVSR